MTDHIVRPCTSTQLHLLLHPSFTRTPAAVAAMPHRALRFQTQYNAARSKPQHDNAANQSQRIGSTRMSATALSSPHHHTRKIRHRGSTLLNLSQRVLYYGPAGFAREKNEQPKNQSSCRSGSRSETATASKRSQPPLSSPRPRFQSD